MGAIPVETTATLDYMFC